MSRQLVIIGAGGNGKVIADIAEKNGYEKIVFLDDNECAKSCGGYPVVGACSDAKIFDDSDFIVGIGRNEIRKKIQEELILNGLSIVTIIHPMSVVASDVSLGVGTVVMAGAIINPGTTVGNGCIINTAATVDHDNDIADYVHVSVGSHIAGTVTVGMGTWIGAGAIVKNNLSICDNCIIGAGAVVVKNITEPGTYIGIPAIKRVNKSVGINTKNSGGSP